MKYKWMWALGIALIFIVLFVPSSLLRSLLTYDGYGMMNYSWHMPMMYGGGIVFLAGLILLGLLILIVLGITWLVKTLTAPK